MLYERIFTKKTLIQISVLVLVSFALMIVAPALTVSAEGEVTEAPSTLADETTFEEPATESTPDPLPAGDETPPPEESTLDTPASDLDGTTPESSGELSESEEETTAPPASEPLSSESQSSENEPPNVTGELDESLGLIMPFGILGLELLGVTPTATVNLSASPIELPASGGSVIYTLTITNTGSESIQLTDISDTTLSGSLSGLSSVTWDGFDPSTELLAGATASGSYTVTYLDSDISTGTPITNNVTIDFTTSEPLTGTATSNTTSIAVVAVEGSFGDPSAEFNGFNGGVDGGGNWTSGNLGKTYAEGEWVPFQLILTDVQNSWGPDLFGMNQYDDKLVISYDFTNGGNRFMDMVRSIQVGEVALTKDQAYPAESGSPLPIGTRDELEYAQIDHAGGPVDIEYAFTGFTLLKTKDSFDYESQVHRLLPDDPSSDEPDTDYEADRRSIVITRQNLVEAGLGDADTIVIYFQLHLSRTLFWQTDLHTQMSAGSRTPPWGGYLYDEPDPNLKNGSGFVSGSSGHAALETFGQKTVPLPVPAEKPGSVTGYKYNDLTGDGPTTDDTPLAGWTIYATIAYAGVPFTMSVITDSTGKYTFPYVSYGEWIISEKLESAYEETLPDSDDDILTGADAIGTPFAYEPDGVTWAPFSWKVVIDDALPSATGINFYNYSEPPPTISVTKTANPTAVPETGGNVTFTFTVENTSLESVTITSLSDSVYGTLAGDADCQVGTVLAVGALASFEMTEWVEGDHSGPDHVNTFTAHAEDADHNDATDSDDATVDFTDVMPTIMVTKTANPTSVPETGGNVTITFVIKNTSTEEPVTITSISDIDFTFTAPEIAGLVGTVLAADASTSFSITRWIEGDYSGPDHHNIFTAHAEDNDQNDVSDDDDATVDFTNILPTIEVTKTANPTFVPETGGNVTFTFIVKNTSSEESVTITSIADSDFTFTTPEIAGILGTVLAADASTSFSIIRWIEGDFSGDDHVNTFTAHAVDNDGTDATDSDDATVDFVDETPTIVVEKTPNVTSVPETGANVTFTFVVTNTSSEEAVTITSLSDSVYGILAGDADCEVGTVLAAGASSEFTITRWVEGDYTGPDHVNVFTAYAEDNDGSEASDHDDATVDFTNVAPAITVEKTANPTAVPETGGDVTFTFRVTNTSSEEPVTITSLIDSVYGTLAGDADCHVGTVLAAGAFAEFSITRWIEGNYTGPDHVNVFTAHAVDNDQTDATDNDDATVDFTNVAPTIVVTKTANPTAVPETGGSVTFTFVVQNTSSEEPVTITSLTDSVFGTLLGDADCQVGTVLAAGASSSFTITRTVEGDYSGPDHVNVFTAHAIDDDGTDAIDDDDATVDFTNVLPTIEVLKTPSIAEVPETGANVTFTFRVTNTSTEESVTITSLSDSVYGILAGDADCEVGTVLAAGAFAEFTITRWVEGDYSGPDHVNVFTAYAEDNDGTEDSDDDDATVGFANDLPLILVTKTANPTAVPETGGNVTFTFTVQNTSAEEPVTITSLSDSVYGTLTGDADCQVGTILAAGASASFSITRWVEGDYSGPDHVNVFTAHAVDNDQTDVSDDDDATVDFTDVAPTIEVTKTPSVTAIPETGADVTFTFVVTNTSTEEPVTITSLADSLYGILSGDADCHVGTVLAAGESRSFTITRFVTGDFSGPDHVNVFTAHAEDNDEHDASDTDDATVDFTDVAPTILVTKVANPTAVPETGGNVTFTFTVQNTSSIESVTILSLVDSVYGTLAGDADCQVGTVLAAGASADFSFTRWVEGDFSGPDHVNVFTAVAEDDDGTDATDDDDATVDFTDVAPTILVTKVANPTSVPETGGNVTFTFTVQNTSTEEPVTITSLSDSIYGTLAGDADCQVGTILAAGASAEFSFTEWVEGDFSGPDHINVFTAHAVDNDQTDAFDDDDATVDFTDVLPVVDLVKSVTPATLTEPGGPFTFTLTITNTSTEEPVTITDLTDTNLIILPQDLLDLIGITIPAGGSVSASYTVTHTTPGIYPNTATVIVVDNDETPATDSSTASVTVTNAIPSITVIKTAITTSVDDPGDVATFLVSITNTSSLTDPVTITSLTDVIEGGPAYIPVLYTTASGTTTLTLPQTILPGATLTVYFFAAIDGDPGDNIDDTVTASGTDDEGTPVTDSDAADVDIDEEPTPTTTVPTFTTSPTLIVFGAEMPETGESDTYTYKVIAFLMLLLSGAFLVLWIKRRHEVKEK